MTITNVGFLIALLFVLSGCGVKGAPLPPEKPVQLGHGVPTFRGASQDLVLPEVSPQPSKEKKKKQESHQ